MPSDFTFKLIELQISANYESIRSARAQLKSALDTLFISVNNKQNQKIVDNIQLVFSECATNFVEHEQGINRIDVLCSQEQNHLLLTIGSLSPSNSEKNLKAWLENSAAIEPDAFDKLASIDKLELFRSGGRGAAIVKSSCDHIEILKSSCKKTPSACALSATTPPATAGASMWQNRIQAQWQLQQGSQLKLLLIEDDPAQNALYSAYLALNYQLCSCTNLNDARQQLKDNDFDLILSDIHLSDGSGFELKKDLLKTNSTSETPFVLMSADSNDKLSTRAAELGADSFILKPFTKHQLLTTIQRVLIRSKQLRRLHDKQLLSRISQTLCARPPQTSGRWRLALHSDGPGEGGGDLIAFENDGATSFIIVADIMGHDVAAKFFSHAYLGYIRGLLSAYKHMRRNKTDLYPDPATFLSGLSQALHSDKLLSASMCTCCVIKLFDQGELHIASAGHPPAWKVTHADTRPLNSGGMLPGLLADISYSTTKHQINSAERIAVVTDGLLDTVPGKASCAEQKLKQSMQASLSQDINTACERSFYSVIQQNTVLTDDAALLMIETI
ncbi:SpoIIE family protein phosphatase [Agaribacterium haliotis]|uniref:SpoIIE family protein phosphatase n=1 Tax=Agaribacterium haliotis TaxID=2013869 RepID=UPI000BB536A0|nr:SpoIIE family protein phosphatase [Agaribacterium haliotis]